MSNKEQTEENAIIDLEAIMLKWSKNLFNTVERRRLKKKYGSLDDDMITAELVADKFIVEHSKEEWPKHKSVFEKPESYVLFESTYVNKTDQPQEYLLRTERKTRSSCAYSIQRGFTIGKGLELEIGLPDNPVIKSNIKLSGNKERQEQRGTELVKEDEITWSVDTNIKVKPKTKATAKLVIQENDFQGDWQTKTRFGGSFEVVYKVKKDSTVLTRVTCRNLKQVLTPQLSFGWDDDRKMPFYISKGTCKCNFAVSQHIDLEEEPASPNS